MTKANTVGLAIWWATALFVAAGAGCVGGARRPGIADGGGLFDIGPRGDSGPRIDMDAPGCTSNAECADAIDCTTDTCVLATGDCEHVATSSLCAPSESCDRALGCIGLDAGPGPVDLGYDAGYDAGSPIDMGVASCNVGLSCTAARGCPAGLACQPEVPFTQGTTADPVYLSSGATTSFEGLYFENGYCTSAAWTSTASRAGSPGACVPLAADATPGTDGCPACARCVSLGDDGTGVDVVQCFQRCTPSATSNPCRSGYACDFASQTCIFGCQTDQECQLYREDTNGDGTLLAPDRLRLDVAGGATCSATTGRCTQPGVAGVVAGATCVLDSQCERDGRCLSEAGYRGWIGGYCTKFGCDVRGCAGDGKCLDVGGGTNLCTDSCRIADDVGDSAMGATGGDDDCRTGYACFWDGVSGPTAAINGGCLPGNYNAVTVENVGAACVDPDGTGPRTSDEVCWSPYGLGRCIFGVDASCTLLGCAMLPAGACGVGNECVELDADTSLCLRTCTTAATCSADSGRTAYGCVDTTGTGSGARHCFPGCMVDTDCNAAFRCAGAVGTTLGECVLR